MNDPRNPDNIHVHTNNNNQVETLALIFGVIGLFLCGATSPIALVLGLVAMKKNPSSAYAITGMIMGLIPTVVWIGWLVMCFVAILAPR